MKLSSPCTRRLLRDLDRNLYYGQDGNWTQDPQLARDFPDMHELIATFELHDLPRAEIVEHYGDRLSDMRMMLTQTARRR